MTTTSYQDEDVSLSLFMKVVCKLRQLAELDFVISEIFLILHVVNVSVLNVLHGKRKNAYSLWEPHLHMIPINMQFRGKKTVKNCLQRKSFFQSCFEIILRNTVCHMNNLMSLLQIGEISLDIQSLIGNAKMLAWLPCIKFILASCMNVIHLKITLNASQMYSLMLPLLCITWIYLLKIQHLQYDLNASS